MSVWVCLLVMGFILSAAVWLAGKLLSRAQEVVYSGASPFECGFEKMEKMEFSLRYFLVALVFLLFDLEVLLLFPSLSSAKSLLAGMLVLVLSGGLFWEWNQGLIDWAK